MADSGDSVTKAPQIGDENPEAVAGMRVLRLCSVFEPVALSGRSARYDAIGGMQNHTAELSRQAWGPPGRPAGPEPLPGRRGARALR